MSHIKSPSAQFAIGPRDFRQELEALGRLPPDAAELMRMACQLGPRDLAALSCIIRRAGEICESDGEEVALAVLDQIGAILDDRRPDA
jgi:hypothetical protein